MPSSPWEGYIHRAQDLAGQHPFAAQILGFYIHLARFQHDLNRHLSNYTTGQSASISNELGPEEFATLLPQFAIFLSMVGAQGPQQLATLSHELNGRGEQAWSALLNTIWTTCSPSDSQGFLARAFLQPFAQLLRTRARLNWSGYAYALCPFCNRKPCPGVLRPLGDGASRWLICSFCLAEWEFRRLICPGCGEEDSHKLSVYTASNFDYVRVECCESCKTYLKTVDLSKNGLAEPIVDEIASAPLDLWAHERGYEKLERNLVGL
jgi:formate dehydrogenase accessory protein FdhE